MPTLPLGVTPREGLFALALGLLSAAGYPPVGLWPLPLVALALLLLLLRDKTSFEARNLGLVYGIAYGLGTMYWFFSLFGVLAVPLIGIFAAYFGLFATLIALTKDRPPLLRAALTALFAVGIDWLRGDAWYLRFPWYTVPHTLAQAPMWIASVQWLGTYGLTFVVWLILAAGAFVRSVCWLALALLPACSYFLPEITPPDHRVLLVQAEDTTVLERLIAEFEATPHDLAVLPEYAYHEPPHWALAPKRNGPAVLARKITGPVVFGAKQEIAGTAKTLPFENLAVVIDADGQILGTFPKQRPLPLFADGVPGTRQPVFELAQGTLGVAICYDFDAPAVAASLVQQGATVLAAPTYDAMWWGRMQHVHHELLLRLRAVENDRWILRAASSGRTEVIDPHGVPSVEGIEIGATGTLSVAYGHRTTQTLGSKLPLLGPVAAAGIVLFIIFSFLTRYTPPSEKAAGPG